MYFPYLLSYLALRVRGRVAPGDVVLVHAAAGGVGSAAVQLAKAFGATVIATAGTDEKVDFCRSLGADYGVNYRTTTSSPSSTTSPTDGESTWRSTPWAVR